MLQQFVQNYDKKGERDRHRVHGGKKENKKTKANVQRTNELKYSERQWIKAGLGLLVRIVMFRRKSDIFNKMRFENILLTAKKALRILLQNAWNVLESNDDGWTLNRKAFIEIFTEIIQKCQDDDKLEYRSSNTWQISESFVNDIVAKIGKFDKEYLEKEQLLVLQDFVRFVGVYYYMDDKNVCVDVMNRLKRDIVDKIGEMGSVEFGAAVMEIEVSVIQSDDMLMTCLSRHIFLEFGDLYDSKSFDRLLQIISPEEEVEEMEESKDNDDDKEMEMWLQDESEDEDEDDDDDGRLRMGWRRC